MKKIDCDRFKRYYINILTKKEKNIIWGGNICVTITEKLRLY